MFFRESVELIGGFLFFRVDKLAFVWYYSVELFCSFDTVYAQCWTAWSVVLLF